MKVLIAHNSYRIFGGEDTVYETETRVLEESGINVLRYNEHNDSISESNRLSSGLNAIWSNRTYKEIVKICAEEKPDIVHVHNVFARISPSIFHAAKSLQIPTVMTVHNYRLGCPAGQFFRDGSVCEDCADKFFPWPSVVHKCYENSRAQTTVRALVYGLGWINGTWSRKVDKFIAVSDFSANKLVSLGVNRSKISVKPNFLKSDPGIGSHDEPFILYVGRLEVYKGVRDLLDLWMSKQCPNIPLKIVGTGSMADSVASCAEKNPSIEYLGSTSRDKVLELMKRCYALVFPSTYYESCPMTIIESFACATPVISAAVGSHGTMVKHNVNGMLYSAGNREELGAAIHGIANGSIDRDKLGLGARDTYIENYTPLHNIKSLIGIYSDLSGSAR